jgi:hypothetical protein
MRDDGPGPGGAVVTAPLFGYEHPRRLPWSAATIVFGFVLPALVFGALSGWFVVGPILGSVLRTLVG